MATFLAPPGLPFSPSRRRCHCRQRPLCTAPSPRSDLLTLLTSQTRVGNDTAIASLVSALECSSPAALTAADPRLPGVWRNLHTTLPPSASPIQRLVIRNVSFAPNVEQVVLAERGRPTRFINRVDLRGALGAVLNVSASVEEVRGRRLVIRFDEAWFQGVALPGWLGGARRRWRVAYPVPFRLLGDKAKGWLDVTYLDEDVRIARGNRGSAFVLQRRDVAVDRIDEYLQTWED